MCGIFAWAGKDPKKFSKIKFDMLGIFNIERGKDSCGASYDGDVYPGIDKNKMYSTFMLNIDIKPKSFPVVIGHTRQASPGNVVNSSNAHPFGFGVLNNKENSFEFIGCHNGTIYNKKEIAELYNVELTESKEVSSSYNDNIKTTTYRNKIDSEILLECLYKSKNFKVLSKYNGGAALVFTNLNEPNTLYVFKGASKSWDYPASVSTVERPLYYYKETKNSLYISSLEESLVAIGGVKNKDIFNFEENTVYKIVDGDIEKAEKSVISRKHCLQKDDTDNFGFTKKKEKTPIITEYTGKKNQNYFNMLEGAFNNDDEVYSNSQIEIYRLQSQNRERTNVLSLAYKASQKIIEKESCNIYTEEPVRNINDYGSRVYYNKFRFHRTGHMITGIYTFIQNYGYYYLSSNFLEEARAKIKSLEGLIFVNGNFITDSDTLDMTDDKYKPYIPFSIGVSNAYYNFHYFIQGVKVLTELDYDTLIARYNNSHIRNNVLIDHVILSQCSTFPVINANVKFKTEESQGILIEGRLVKDVKKCFLGTERIYTILNGNLTHYVDNINSQKVIFGDEKYTFLKTFEDLDKYIEDKNPKQITIPFKEIKVNEVTVITDDEFTEGDILKELYDEQLIEFSCEISEFIKQLQEYSNTIDPKLIEDKVKNLESLQDWIEVLIK